MFLLRSNLVTSSGIENALDYANRTRLSNPKGSSPDSKHVMSKKYHFDQIYKAKTNEEYRWMKFDQFSGTKRRQDPVALQRHKITGVSQQATAKVNWAALSSQIAIELVFSSSRRWGDSVHCVSYGLSTAESHRHQSLYHWEAHDDVNQGVHFLL